MPSASWTLEMCFDKSIAGILAFDRSTFGGTDVFSEAPPGLFDGTYADITDDVNSDIVATRGRTDFLGQMNQGTLDVVVSRPTDPTFWDPNSPSSPIYRGTVNPGFVPMRPCRLKGTYAAVTHTRFYGFLATAVYDPDTLQCTLHFEDLYLWLNRVGEPAASYSGITTGAAWGHLLDTAQWTDPSMRQLATGDLLASFAPDGSKKILERGNDLLNAERGCFYIRGDGVSVYDDRHARWIRSSIATFNDVAVAFVSGVDLANIRSRGVVTKGATTINWSDTTSIQAYGPGDATTIASDYILDAQGLADYLKWLLADPLPPLRVTVESDSAATLTAQLTIDLQQKITVVQSRSEIPSGDYFVEQLTDTISVGGGDLLTSEYLVSTVGAGVLIFDVSTFDMPAPAPVYDY